MSQLAKIQKFNLAMYSVSIQELIEIWVETMHPTDHIVVIWDVLKHLEFLENLGIKIEKVEVYNNKILTISTFSLEESLIILAAITIENGPFAQVFSLGRFITDNIDK